MSALQGLDPRLHLTAAIGWAVFSVCTLVALAGANLAAALAEKTVHADTERLLHQFAQQSQGTLAMNLMTRLSIMQTAAAQIAASSDRGDEALRRHVEVIQAQFPEFAWIGVADSRGRVLAATGGTLVGADVSNRPWFEAAARGPWLGEAHAAVLPSRLLPAAPNGQPARFVDAAVPLLNATGGRVGVIGAHLAWRWIEQLRIESLRALDSRRQLELLLVAADGAVLAGPERWLGKPLRDGAADPTEGGAYIVSDATMEVRPRLPGLAWTVVMRQSRDAALADAWSVQRSVFGIVFLAGLLAAIAAVLMTRHLTRRLSRLAQDAVAVRRGLRVDLAVPPGRDEISRIGATLAEAVAQIQSEKNALRELNHQLDAKVAERTARIERLAEEQKHGAVVRERLRLARDLHDTLAHSLMALLTQIRMVRKLRGRLDDRALEEELARAEAVAAGGLAEARAAITQMRHNNVRDAGLLDAIRDILKRFTERTGVAHQLRAEDLAVPLSSEAAETVFRIAEEALHNVERHAQAREVSVALTAIGATSVGLSRLRLEIADDGVGFEPRQERPGHYGLRGMGEQAALIHARLDIDSRPNAGTRVVLEFEI